MAWCGARTAAQPGRTHRCRLHASNQVQFEWVSSALASFLLALAVSAGRAHHRPFTQPTLLLEEPTRALAVLPVQVEVVWLAAGHAALSALAATLAALGSSPSTRWISSLRHVVFALAALEADRLALAGVSTTTTAAAPTSWRWRGQLGVGLGVSLIHGETSIAHANTTDAKAAAKTVLWQVS